MNLRGFSGNMESPDTSEDSATSQGTISAIGISQGATFSDNGEDDESILKDDRNHTSCIRLSALNRDGRSAFTPYKPSTVLTNLQRGNVQTQTTCQLPERSVHQLAAQGELFAHHLDEDNTLLNLEDENGFTPLLWASSCGQLATVHLLLDRNADVSISGKQGETALLFASANGHAHIVRKLVQHKADVNEKDKDGNTSLMYTSFCNHALCTHELLTAGADITLKNNNDETAYNIAIARGNKQVQAVMEKYMLNLLNTSV